MKDNIKELISIGSKISIPHKTVINEYYGEMKIFPLKNDLFNTVYVIEPGWIQFVDIDDAVNYFCYHAFTSRNIGLIQNRLHLKNLTAEDTNFEKPSKELKELFKKEGELLDSEVNNFIVEPTPFPTVNEAKGYASDILNNAFDIKTIGNKLIEFKRKFITIDPSIHIYFIYECENPISSSYKNQTNSSYNYSMSCNLNEINEKRLIEARKFTGPKNDMRYKYVRIIISMNRNAKDECTINKIYED